MEGRGTLAGAAAGFWAVDGVEAGFDAASWA
jgi:hypothetical protein